MVCRTRRRCCQTCCQLFLGRPSPRYSHRTLRCTTGSTGFPPGTACSALSRSGLLPLLPPEKCLPPKTPRTPPAPSHLTAPPPRLQPREGSSPSYHPRPPTQRVPPSPRVRAACYGLQDDGIRLRHVPRVRACCALPAPRRGEVRAWVRASGGTGGGLLLFFS